MQTTLKSEITLVGTGLHSGQPARLTIRPAAAGHGVWFRRTDITDRDNMVAARFECVSAMPLCTELCNAAGASVATVEHVMAALAGCGVHNALIDVSGPEVPVFDGSAVHIVRAIVGKGLRLLNAPVSVLRILEPVGVASGDAAAWFTPSERFEMDFEIEFSDPAIGRQSLSLDMANGRFVRELCDSRTFCRESDIKGMRAAGLALGGTLDNAVVVDGARVLTPGGMRHADECVRHKMLDALGDLALLGVPMVGRYSGVRAGHALTNTLLRKLFATPRAFEVTECDADTAARLPGVGVSFEDLRSVA